ncbi:hypothetical protein NXW95_22930 [Phocaeicola vulgatus]|nr:hypothetical protein [Phocaeicola vulgatus]
MEENNKWIFDPTGLLFQLKLQVEQESYEALSFRNQELVEGIYDFTYPDAPDVTPDKIFKMNPMV